MIPRRIFLIGSVAALSACMSSSHSLTLSSDAPEDWLSPTRHINHAHPKIQAIARERIKTESTERGRALAAFHFVRDEIKFGFARGFWDMSASNVASAGVGYCNTKSTLFVALLRASDVPARQVFVDIHSGVLSGLINPGTTYVDHSFVEVWLDGAWIATDAYIVDPALFKAAQPRLLKENRLLGYGVHQTGSNDWDGRSEAFSQFNRLDPRPMSQRHWGAFADVGDFYRHAPGTHNRLNPVLRTGFGLLAAQANQAAEALRRPS